MSENHLCLGSTDKNIRSFTPHCRPEIRKYLLAPPLVTSDDTRTFQLANWMTCKHLQAQLVNSYDMKIFPNIFAGDPNDRKHSCATRLTPRMIRKHFRVSSLVPRMIGKTFSSISAGTPDDQKISHPLTLYYHETFQGISTGATDHRKTFTSFPLSPRMIEKHFRASLLAPRIIV